MRDGDVVHLSNARRQRGGYGRPARASGELELGQTSQVPFNVFSAAPGMRRAYDHEAVRASMLCTVASRQPPLLMVESRQSAILRFVILYCSPGVENHVQQ